MSKTFPSYASCVLTSCVQKELDYGIDLDHLGKIEVGSLVQVPLRGRLVSAVVTHVKSTSTVGAIKPIHKLLHPQPLMTPKLFQLAKWMSDYYVTDLSKVLKLFFPKAIRDDVGHKKQLMIKKGKSVAEMLDFCKKSRSKKPKQVAVVDELLKIEGSILLTELLEKAKASRASIQGLEKMGYIQVETAYVDRCPLEDAEFFTTKPKVLNDQQNSVLRSLHKDLETQAFHVSLLHGVTGSGKTEVYLRIIDACLKKHKSALMLVPEIALTTQTIEKFRGRFPGQIAVLHHRLSQGERYDAWHRIQRNEVQIVIGARSAIFAPLQNLGLVIVDEEHESSYKQTEEMPAYHARDLAVMRAKIESALVLLGSATPSFESYYNALTGKYKLLEMQARISKHSLPKIHLVDMKNEIEKNTAFTLFSEKLLKAIKDRFQKGEQSLLFLNRKGYHTTLICKGCGEIVCCPNCDIALTFHLKVAQLACHLCDYHSEPLKFCPKCKEATMQYKGIGTEKVEMQLKKIIPELRIIRMDGDTTRHKGSYQKLYYAFRNQKADVLIGTQMVAKGLDFPNVTLVGILNGDSQLNIPDFRGGESAFQLITQVAGRAGRGASAGEVYLQTFRPENRVLQLAIHQDFKSFYSSEINSRSLFSFSPYLQLVKIVFRGEGEKRTLARAEQCFRYLKGHCPSDAFILDPLPCGYPKIKSLYRFQILIKTKKLKSVLEPLREYSKIMQKQTDIRFIIDVNPASTFF